MQKYAEREKKLVSIIRVVKHRLWEKILEIFQMTYFLLIHYFFKMWKTPLMVSHFSISASLMVKLNANVLFTGVKFSLRTKFLSMEFTFFLFHSAYKQFFLLTNGTITFFFFFPWQWHASISFEILFNIYSF